MQPGSDIAPQEPATDPEQEAWRRLTTVEARLEHQAGQLTEILTTFHELRLYVEQRAAHTVPRDSGPTTVQPADAAQTPAHSDPLSAQSFTRGGDRLRPAPPDSFDGEREKGRAFINSCDLYMSLTPDAFPDEQTRINWVLSYMKGGRAARFAARTLRYPNSHGGVPRFGTYAEFRTQFIAEFCPRDEKRKAATTFETSAYHQGSRSVDEYIDEFWDLAEEAQFPDGAQLVFRFRHGLDPRIEAKVANIVEGRPSDERVQEWIDAARLVDYNTRAHQDFRSAVTKPRTAAPAPVVRNPGAPAAFRALPAPPPRPVAAAPSAPTVPASRPLPSGVPMDIDLSRQRSGTPIICRRCKKPGHIARDCPEQFDIRSMTTEERDDWVMGLLADLDAVRAAASAEAQAEAPAAAEEERPEESAQSLSIAALSTHEPDSNEDVPPSSAITKSNFGPPDSDVPEVTITIRCRRGLPRWEKRLPRSFTLAATPSRNSLILGVEVMTTDTQEILGLKALLDSGASGLFLHIRFVREHGITTRTLSRPIPVKNTLEEHRRITRIVLDCLREHRLFLKPEKCEFERTEIEYLGLIISHGTASMDPVKVAGVAEWPVPKNKKEVQSFLGFTNFYRRFIRDFSHHARPLFDLTAKDVAWTWGSGQQDAFDSLKRAITSKPVLIFPDDDRPFRVEAAPEDEKWHPVAFYSKSLNAVERNYEIHDKEMLAIIRALEEWRHFLEGARHKVDIYTDHKNLQYFLTAKKLNRRQARWSLYLANFDFVLHHRPGRSMGKPDALSRRADHGDGSADNADIVLLKPEFFAIRALQGLIAAGEEDKILQDIRRGNREGAQEDVVAKAAAALKSARSGVRSVRSAEWSEDQGILMFRGRIYVPNIPELRHRIVEQHHDSRVAGHPGRWKTLELVSRSYWWPQMPRYIGSYTSTCDLCQRTKVRRQLPMGQLHLLPIPEGCWSVVSVDFIVELPEAHGYDAVMVVVDSVGKRAHFIPTHTTCTAMGAANLYRKHVWKLHGLPDAFVSDRGPQFIAEFTQELYRLLGIKLSTSTAYHPQSDGQTERVNQELEQYLRVFCNERQDDWDDLLPEAEFQYNNHVHSATKFTPFMLDTGRNPRMGFEPRPLNSNNETANEFFERMKLAQEEAKAALAKAKDDMARYYDQRRIPAPEYKPGDRVYLDASDIQTTRPSWFDVEDILDSRFSRRKLQYKVKWKGYGYEDASWEPVENVAHARDLVREFHRRHPDAPKQVRGMFLVNPAALRAARAPVHRGAAP
ncbi:putative retrotransposable element tf2 155 kda protein type 1-like [Lyophyllum shimeji]|uniref:Retrotransposable element tf2 155 kDa protein type 1-like n=1 Tax=Lyophyllum shimeji TaxID=47721 RepID=A0A9P3PVR7_LYOSH|nr:putative retrotransposable element tf2 155 kda protein type 1-like [Lyophyllum shimeji]